MTDKKLKCVEAINEAIKNAIRSGFTVVVATDEEGNNWNIVDNTKYAMVYEDSKPNVIALGVWSAIDEQDIFNE
jgi:hypothetical protein